MNVKRIVVFSLLVILLPLLAGFISAFLTIGLEGPTLPVWYVVTRATLFWIGPILVFAVLSTKQHTRRLAHVAVVALIGWIGGDLLILGLTRAVASVPGVPPIELRPLELILRSLGTVALQAVIGTAIGLALTRKRQAPEREAA